MQEVDASFAIIGGDAVANRTCQPRYHIGSVLACGAVHSMDSQLLVQGSLDDGGGDLLNDVREILVGHNCPECHWVPAIYLTSQRRANKQVKVSIIDQPTYQHTKMSITFILCISFVPTRMTPLL